MRREARTIAPQIPKDTNYDVTLGYLTKFPVTRIQIKEKLLLKFESGYKFFLYLNIT
jgi:hypothetical protein